MIRTVEQDGEEAMTTRGPEHEALEAAEETMDMDRDMTPSDSADEDHGMRGQERKRLASSSMPDPMDKGEAHMEKWRKDVMLRRLHKIADDWREKHAADMAKEPAKVAELSEQALHRPHVASEAAQAILKCSKVPHVNTFGIMDLLRVEHQRIPRTALIRT